MMLRLGWTAASSGGELAVAEQVLDQAVVPAELDELVVAEEVDPGVADVDPGDLVALGPGDHPDGAQRGAHAVELRFRAGLLEDGPVADAGRLLQVLERGLAGVLLEALDRHGRGHLAAVVAAHAVGHAVQVGVEDDHERVLVVGPHLADVGGAPRAQRGHTSSSTVLPTWSRSPRRMTFGPCTFWRLRNVPLVDPRSSTNICPSRTNTRAWICEA